MEIDPVILQLRADVDKYQADVKRVTKTVDQQFGLQEKRAKRLENEMRGSSGKISSTLKGLAGTFAAAFSVRQLAGLADSFTRLQNNLRVAGQEGEGLAAVQASLLAISQKYGVEIETLSAVFLKASLAQKELGASTEEIIRLNEIVAASLKITGTSAAQARGALLQLGQALGSDIVRGEEFNSLLENALPIVQAAARGIDGFEGSVARLRKAVVDGKVTSQAFFEGVLKGGVQTLEDAEKATLTLSGGFTALTSALTVYFGEADKANGVSTALGAALEKLADNLNILIPALAIISTVFAGRFVAGALAGGTALRAISAHAAIAATSMAGAGLAARSAGAALLGAFGGPVGLAITAVVLGLGAMAATSSKAAEKTKRLADEASSAAAKADLMESRLREAGVGADRAGDGASNAAGKVKTLGAELDKTARSARQAAIDLIALESLEIAKRRGQLNRQESSIVATAEAKNAAGRLIPVGKGGALKPAQSGDLTRAEQRALQVSAKEQAALDRQERALRLSFESGVDILSEPSGGGGSSAPATAPIKASGGSGGRSGPTAEDIAARQLDEISRLQQEEIQARLQLATGASERADLERELLTAEFVDRKRQIESDVDLNRQQKDAQIAILQNLFGIESALDEQGIIVVNANKSLLAQAINREESAQLERELADLAEERFRAAEDALRLQFELADTDSQRRALAFKILAAEDEYLKSKLKAVIASDTIAGAEKDRARIALAGINDTAGARREVVARQNEGALARFARGTLDVDARIEELAVRKIQDINDTIADTMAKQFGIKDQFIADLLSIFLQEALFGPLAKGLSGAGGGGGLFGSILGAVGSFAGSGSSSAGSGSSSAGSTDGGLTGALGSIFGRASGGAVSAGQIYRVNEGASPGRVEAFQPSGSGNIIPLGRMDALRGGGGGNQLVTVRLALSGDIDAKIDQRSAQVAVEVTRQAAPSIIDASANETLRRSGRPRL